MLEYKKLVDTQDEYIALLVKEIESMLSIAYVHGWRSDNHEAGSILREKIASLKQDAAKTEQEGVKWVNGCPPERKAYHAKYRFLKEDAEIKDGLIYPLQDTIFWEALSVNSRNYIEDVQIVAYLNESGAVKEAEPAVDPVAFDDAMEAEINKLPYRKHLDDGQYNDGQLAGFELGANWARQYGRLPVNGEGEQKQTLPVYDLSQLDEVDKQEFGTETMKSASEVLMATFYSLGCITHLDQMSINDANGDQFILAFRKIAGGKILGPLLPMEAQQSPTDNNEGEQPLTLDPEYPCDAYRDGNFLFSFGFSKTIPEDKQIEMAQKYIAAINATHQPAPAGNTEGRKLTPEEAKEREDAISWYRGKTEEACQEVEKLRAAGNAGRWINLAVHPPCIVEDWEDWHGYHMRYASDRVKLDLHLFELRGGALCKIGGTGRLELSEVEWLDESAGGEQGEAEAVAFGEFLKGFAPIEHERGVYGWWDKIIGGKHYTTSELYKLFKEQSKQQ